MIKQVHDCNKSQNKGSPTETEAYNLLHFTRPNKNGIKSVTYLRKLMLLLERVEEMKLRQCVYSNDKEKLVNTINTNTSVIAQIIKENIRIASEICNMDEQKRKERLENLKNVQISKEHAYRKCDSFPKSYVEIESDSRFPKSTLLIKKEKNNAFETDQLSSKAVNETRVNLPINASRNDSNSVITIKSHKSTDTEIEINNIISEIVTRFCPDRTIKEGTPSHSSSLSALSSDPSIGNENSHKFSTTISSIEEEEILQYIFDEEETPLINRDVNLIQTAVLETPVIENITKSFDKKDEGYFNAADVVITSTSGNYTGTEFFLGNQTSSSTTSGCIFHIPQQKWIQKP